MNQIEQLLAKETMKEKRWHLIFFKVLFFLFVYQEKLSQVDFFRRFW